MKKLCSLLLIILFIATGITLPFLSNAATLYTANAIQVSNDPATRKCTDVTSKVEKNGEIEIGDTTTERKLVKYYAPGRIGSSAFSALVSSIPVIGGVAGPLTRDTTNKNPVGTLKYYVCSTEALNILGEQTLNGFQQFLITLLNGLLWLVDAVSEFLLWFFAKLVVSMIKQGTFINQTIVKEGWPFIQGVTNLGFIFVLLYIALATTLRIETIGTSIQRLLPKLLIGALLVNFSLVIGGLLIDTSRLFMAAEIRLIGGADVSVDNLHTKLLEKSRYIEKQVSSFTHPGAKGSFVVTVLRLFQGSLFRVLMAAAFGVIAINLFVRYIALLILLIFSPIPYLAFILPKTKDIADKWWGMFLKWVFYGPIVIFFLVLITQIQNIDIPVDKIGQGDAFNSDAFKEFVRFIIIVALFFVANTVGKKFAGVGSDAVMSFAAKNKRATAAIGLGVATGGLAAPLLAGAGYLAGRAGARGAANMGRDFSDKFKKDFAATVRGGELFGKDTRLSKAAKLIAGPERDDKGKLKKGETSPGLSAAKTISKRLGLGDPRKQAEEAAIKKELANIPLGVDITNGELIVPNNLKQYINGAGLSQGHVTKAIGKKNLEMVVEYTPNKSDLAGLAQNEDHLRELGSDGRSELIQTIGKNQHLQPNDKADIVNRIVRTVKDKDL